MGQTERPAVLHVATEAVLHRDPDGQIWGDPVLGETHWTPYLAAFDQVRIVARVVEAPAVSPGACRLDAPGLSVTPLPPYSGVSGLLRHVFHVVAILWAQSRSVEIALLRLPGPIGSIFGILLTLRQRPFAVQLVGDIDEVLGIGDFPLTARLARRPLVWITRRLCRAADPIAYVTARTLQIKYPGAIAARFAFSDVQLELSDIPQTPPLAATSGTPAITFCGSLAQRYKGLDVLLKAVRLLQDAGLPLRVTVIGDGANRPSFERLSAELGLLDVSFEGQVPRERVRSILASTDLFVMPSRTEGLPRALIEAMASGLPCIGARVGGIPELLSEDALVPRDDPAALAAAIRSFLESPERMNREAARNLEIARQYAKVHLEPLRTRFVTRLRDRADSSAA